MYIQSGELVIILRLKRLYKNLGTRLIVIIMMCGIIPMVMLKMWIMREYENNLYNQSNMQIKKQCSTLQNTIANSDYFSGNSVNLVNTEIAQLASVYDGRIMIIDNNFKVVRDTYYIDEGKISISPNVIECFSGNADIYIDRQDGYIEYTVPVYGNDEKEIIGSIVAVFSMEENQELLEKVNTRASIVVLIASVIIIFLGIYFSIYMTEPLKKLENAIKKVSGGYNNEAISLSEYTYTELDEIAKAFNDNAEKMRKLNDSRQEFVSNVSHELKTPITSIKVLADSLVSQEGISIEYYREFLRDIVDEIDRESEIINDLLSLSKLERRDAVLNVESMNINDLLEMILKRLRPIAAKNNIELVFESFRPVIAEVDEVKFTMAVQNLVENAIKYNVLDGWVRVSLNADHRYFYIKVSDSGIGIPQEDIKFIFERFYRVDKARSRETGGTGLGLSIAKAVIESHMGEIKVYSREGEGTTFSVRIPIARKNRQRNNED